MIIKGLDGLENAGHPVCVVGSGPVGLSVAMELARLGQRVLVLESGDERPDPALQALSDADIANPATHVAMNIGVERSLGGTSNLWGGRCVSLVPLDLQRRAAIPHSGWPIGWDQVETHLGDACAYIGCGEPVFDKPVPAFQPGDDDFAFQALERWARRPRFAELYGKSLRADPLIELRLRATVTGMHFGPDGRVTGLDLRDGERRATIAPRQVILALGGLETARMLLAARRDAPQRFGGEDGPLGRYYMGHLYGVAAEMDLSNPAVETNCDFFRDPVGYYLSRRFTPSAALLEREGLINACLWPDYPMMRDPIHRNGILSLAYLVLSIPPVGRRMIAESIRRHYVGDEVHRLPHIWNVIRDTPRVAMFLPSFLYHRYLAEFRLPGFFQRNAAKRYAVRFHAEHLPDPESRVTLTDRVDAYGTPRAAVDFRYTRRNAEMLVRLHECFGDWLARTGTGRMTWLAPEAERADYILAQCYDGHHQIGTARMGLNEREAVVDADCRVFGSANLSLAGSAVFPTSGEANPTLTAVALGVRLARRVAAETAGMAG